MNYLDETFIDMLIDLDGWYYDDNDLLQLA